MLNELIGVGIALCVSGLSIADAGAGPARCEGCTDSEFAAKARSMGQGEHVISSFSTGKLAVFKVEDINGGKPDGSIIWSAKSVPVSPEIKAAFNRIEPLYQQYGERMRALAQVRADELDVPGLKAANAFQVMSDINMKLRLGDQLAHKAFLELGDLVRTLDQMDGSRFGLSVAGDESLEATVILNDDSRVVYRVPVMPTSGQYLQDRSRTPEGNSIPEANTPKYQGHWTGSPREVQSLASYLRDYLNVPVDIPSGVQADGLRCKWDSNTLRCNLESADSGMKSNAGDHLTGFVIPTKGPLFNWRISGHCMVDAGRSDMRRLQARH